jgi:hypothetical protein
MTGLIKQIKENNQDFEWYPTSKKMLEIVAADIRRELYGNSFSILDIGAGNGSALKILCELTKNDGQKYAIEKSKILIDALPSDVFVIGTDFHQQTLIDKKVDIVFCNPPYSEYEEWVRKISAEANCKIIYMVIPQRWKTIISKRCDLKGCEVLDSMSFEDSEFRKARAQVDIVKIKSSRGEYLKDPFSAWFDDTFTIKAGDIDDEEEPERDFQEVVAGQNLIEHLEKLYRADFDKLLETYRALEKIDAHLFKELGVDMAQVKGGLRIKIEGLKALYWKELFGNLDAITSHLTSDSRKKLLDRLTAHTSVDFNSDNAYAVVVWAIKNANQYFDSQLVDLYYSLADRDNVRNYKSNKRLIEDGWRYQRREMTHFTLDYRLIVQRYLCFPDWQYEKINGLNKSAHDLLGDICTIATNLGLPVSSDSRRMQWSPGTPNEFFFTNEKLFMDVRAHKKGTIHIRCDQEFMKRLNIEAARINKWVKGPAEAVEETGIEEAAELYGLNFKLKSIPLLTEGIK